MNTETIIELLKTKVPEGHVDYWMTAQHVAFMDGKVYKTVYEMIELGRGQEVYDFFVWAF